MAYPLHWLFACETTDCMIYIELSSNWFTWQHNTMHPINLSTLIASNYLLRNYAIWVLIRKTEVFQGRVALLYAFVSQS